MTLRKVKFNVVSTIHEKLEGMEHIWSEPKRETLFNIALRVVASPHRDCTTEEQYLEDIHEAWSPYI